MEVRLSDSLSPLLLLPLAFVTSLFRFHHFHDHLRGYQSPPRTRSRARATPALHCLSVILDLIANLAYLYDIPRYAGSLDRRQCR